MHLFARDLGARTSFRSVDIEAKVDIHGKPLPGWACYPAGVAWALQQAGFEVPAIEAVYTSDIPIGAGLSSSAAVEVGFAALWETLGGWRLERLELARLCQQAENLYVGVSSGLMDQFASACGVKDHALVFDTRSLEWEPIALPQDTTLVIADSGLAAQPDQLWIQRPPPCLRDGCEAFTNCAAADPIPAGCAAG